MKCKISDLPVEKCVVPDGSFVINFPSKWCCILNYGSKGKQLIHEYELV